MFYLILTCIEDEDEYLDKEPNHTDKICLGFYGVIILGKLTRDVVVKTKGKVHDHALSHCVG